MNIYRKLLVEGTNSILKSDYISLNMEEKRQREGYLITDIFGYKSAVLWMYDQDDEIKITVWWKYNHELNPNQKEKFRNIKPVSPPRFYKNFVGIIISGWLERRDGKYIRGKEEKEILKKYSRTGEIEYLKEVDNPVPIGYFAEGS